MKHLPSLESSLPGVDSIPEIPGTFLSPQHFSNTEAAFRLMVALFRR